MDIQNDTDLTCYVDINKQPAVLIACLSEKAVAPSCLWGVIKRVDGEIVRFPIPQTEVNSRTQLVLPPSFNFQYNGQASWHGLDGSMKIEMDGCALGPKTS
jgi:hypothetical protein